MLSNARIVLGAAVEQLPGQPATVLLNRPGVLEPWKIELPEAEFGLYPTGFLAAAYVASHYLQEVPEEAKRVTWQVVATIVHFLLGGEDDAGNVLTTPVV